MRRGTQTCQDCEYCRRVKVAKCLKLSLKYRPELLTLINGIVNTNDYTRILTLRQFIKHYERKK